MQEIFAHTFIHVHTQKDSCNGTTAIAFRRQNNEEEKENNNNDNEEMKIKTVDDISTS